MDGAREWGACHLHTISELSLRSSLIFGKYFYLSITQILTKNGINVTDFPCKTLQELLLKIPCKN